MDASFWKERLDRCPAMRPWLMPAARYAVTADALPATLTLGPVPENKTGRQALEELFPDSREENGRLKARLDASLRERERWLPLADLLGVKPAEPKTSATPDERLAQSLQRLKVLYPDDTSFINTLRRSDQLHRFFRTADSAPDDLVALFEALVSLRVTTAGLTLSELGAKWFNDSKALRNGPLRQQFEHLLRLQSGDDDSDSTSLLNAYGIIENPYTTHVVVFAPFAYRTSNNEWFDWPYRLWQRCEAAILSWRTVRSITAIHIEKPFSLRVTSENAAPFHRLVENRCPALYTEGYPNAAVKTLLRHFAQTGLACLHWGDTDLDGYRIADQVASQISSRMYTPPIAEPALHGHLQWLSDEQRRRIQQFMGVNPDFPYLAELHQTLRLGWLEQEQTIDLFAGKSPTG